MRATLIAELASGHGGDLDLAKDLISVAAENGWDIAKTQAFQVKTFGNIYGRRVCPYIIPPSETCPLDSPEDWQRAEELLSR